MHPNPAFRRSDQALHDKLIREVAFGTVFLTTPDGPRAAHVPVLAYGQDDLRFHLARRNALTPHLDGARALITVNGPDGYISPRWYDNRDTVPTWDYAALELEGTVERLSDDALETLLHDVITTFEGRIEGDPWLASESSEEVWSSLFKGIAGFSLKVEEQRPTFKLSQKKNDAERARIAARVRPQLAHWMHEVGQ
ncbi:MAG: FMN-binding negative transcriptional regulator [Erythrobacter sp.]|uniref:FMN-binding negative transcriptional regulator n=1 Tax=Erythrobacter sp. TaxID=1042 RepID=UPI00329A0DA0